MAGTSNYKILLEAVLNPNSVKGIDATISAMNKRNAVVLNINFNSGDMAKVNAQLDALTKQGNKIVKVDFFEDAAGGIRKMDIAYQDMNGNLVKTQKNINNSIDYTQKRTVDYANNLKTIEQQEQKRLALNAKIADELGRSANNADRFLAKSQNMKSSPQLTKAVDTAQRIKSAVSAGDIESVRKLNAELAVHKASLAGVAEGAKSWSQGIREAIKQSAEYAVGIGLVFGALNKLKEGVTYIKDLNKEMTNIQVLQVDGAKSNEQIANLAVQYNGLAKEVGATTLEVVRGSTEWLRQGKTIEQTQGLLRSTMMLSKLGNLDSAQSTEYLTATLNGFQMEASRAEEVVNKLIAVKFAAIYGNI